MKKTPDSDMRGIVYREKKDRIAGLPLYWNSEVASQFLSEHLYMFYGEPKSIDIKIDSSRYTLLHDYVGAHYSFKKHLDEKWDLVTVKCVPEALEKWVLQNNESVEIVNTKI